MGHFREVMSCETARHRHRSIPVDNAFSTSDHIMTERSVGMAQFTAWDLFRDNLHVLVRCHGEQNDPILLPGKLS